MVHREYILEKLKWFQKKTQMVHRKTNGNNLFMYIYVNENLSVE